MDLYMKKTIYLDNAATTKTRPEVVEAMLPYFDIRYANPSGIYAFSQNVKHEINKARKTLALSINANEDEIFITSGGTESDNWALKMSAHEHKGGHIITTKIEHHAILRTCKYLENTGVEVTYIDTDEYGNVNVSDIVNAIRKNTFLISVMTANNEIGTIQPIERIANIAKQKNILFHTDAVQAYTNLSIDVKRQNIDMLSTSAHKICGPKGVGFLYIRKGCLSTPFINGGGQENGMRAGTENVAGIIGFAKAAQIAMSNKRYRISREIELENGQRITIKRLIEISENEKIDLKDLILILGCYKNAKYKTPESWTTIRMNQEYTKRELVNLIKIELKYLQKYGSRMYKKQEVYNICEKYGIEIDDFLTYIYNFKICYYENSYILSMNRWDMDGCAF